MKKIEEKQGWLLTFSDLLSLLLTFFILLFSLSTTETKDDSVETPDQAGKIKTYKSFDSRAVGYIYANIVNKFDDKDIIIHKLHNKIMISFDGDKIFDGNSLHLNDWAQKIISTLYEIIYNIKSRIDVVGHVNYSLVQNDSNFTWSNILLKSCAVAKELQEDGYDSQKIRCYSADDSYFFTMLAKVESLSNNYYNSDKLKIDIFILPNNE